MSVQTGQDWQLNKKSVQERNACMFNNAEMSDIQLSCGETYKEVFYAHKYVLATSSPVFHRMFHGSLPETSSVVHLTDTDKESLEAFLRYLYTDQTPTGTELALKVIYLAHKYMITALTAECVKIVKAKLTAQNAWLVFTYATLVGEDSLKESGWQVVDTETRAVIKSGSFHEIDASLLSDFLKRDSLRITELELFHAVLKWSDYQCRRRDLEVTGENRKLVLGDAIYHLRFLAMSQDEFVQNVIPTGLLKIEDSLSILQKFLGFDPASLKWPVTKKRSDYLRCTTFDVENVTARTPPSSTWRYLFASVRYRFYGNPDPYFSWDYSRGANDYLNFRVVKTVKSRRLKQEAVMFHGVRLFGDAHGSTYHVTMKTTELLSEYNAMNGETCSGTYTSEFIFNSYGFDVVFSKPVRIELNLSTESSGGRRSHYPKSYTFQSKWYTIELMIKGPRSYYGVGRNTVRMCKHNYVEFQNNNYRIPNNNNNNNTCAIIGQVFQLLMTPCQQPCKACEEARQDT
jgi:hypothetical protein